MTAEPWLHPGALADGYVWWCLTCPGSCSTENRFPDMIVVFLDTWWKAHAGHHVRILRPELAVRPDSCVQPALTPEREKTPAPGGGLSAEAVSQTASSSG